jgi:diguanylate cyclase (GGDEF)-like protein
VSADAASRPTLRIALARVQFRMTLLTILLAASGGLLSSVVVVDGYVRANLKLVGRLASYNAEPAVVFQDRTAMIEVVRPFVENDDVRAITLVAGNQQVEVSRPGTDRLLPRAESRVAEILWPVPVIEPIRHKGHVIGQARVYAGFGGLGRYLILATLCGIGCLILAMSVTHVLSLRLQRRIAEPLRSIANLAHRVRTERALHLRAPPAPISELQSLGEDFNALLVELETWHSHLRSERDIFEHKASHDPLTGLANRAAFEERLSAEVNIAASTGATLGLLYIDANRFKAVNDQYGHQAGDVLLIEIAARIRRGLRRIDLAARLGGDEFAILVAPPPGGAEIGAIAQRIQSAMSEPVILPGGSEIIPSVSIGSVTYPYDGTDAETLVRKADEAMYLAKNRKLRA